MPIPRRPHDCFLSPPRLFLTDFIERMRIFSVILSGLFFFFFPRFNHRYLSTYLPTYFFHLYIFMKITGRLTLSRQLHFFLAFCFWLSSYSTTAYISWVYIPTFSNNTCGMTITWLFTTTTKHTALFLVPSSSTAFMIVHISVYMHALCLF